MPDILLGGQPGAFKLTPTQIYNLLLGQGASSQAATYLTYASTHHEDPSGQLGLTNNDPSTGDYSVGLFQINYYGSLYPSRTASYGTPNQLAGNATEQAKAAVQIYNTSGPGAWPSSYADLQQGLISGYSPGGTPSPPSTAGNPAAANPGSSGAATSSSSGGVTGDILGSVEELGLRLLELAAALVLLYLGLKALQRALSGNQLVQVSLTGAGKVGGAAAGATRATAGAGYAAGGALAG